MSSVDKGGYTIVIEPSLGLKQVRRLRVIMLWIILTLLMHLYGLFVLKDNWKFYSVWTTVTVGMILYLSYFFAIKRVPVSEFGEANILSLGAKMPFEWRDQVWDRGLSVLGFELAMRKTGAIAYYDVPGKKYPWYVRWGLN